MNNSTKELIKKIIKKEIIIKKERKKKAKKTKKRINRLKDYSAIAVYMLERTTIDWSRCSQVRNIRI